jgi:hypothetical protein
MVNRAVMGKKSKESNKIGQETLKLLFFGEK